MNTSVSSSSSASSITRSFRADDEMVRLFAPLFATRELALTALKHFAQVEWISLRDKFSWVEIKNAEGGITAIQCAPATSGIGALFSMNVINELIRKNHRIVFVKNFPVLSDDKTHWYALASVVIFTSLMSTKGAMGTDFLAPAEDAVGYAVSRFPNLTTISQDSRNAFVYSRIYKNIDPTTRTISHVTSISFRYTKDSAIGAGSERGNWFLELMRGNVCDALTAGGEEERTCLFFQPNTNICLAYSLNLDPDNTVDHPSENEIRTLPENSSTPYLPPPIELGELHKLEKMMFTHTALPRTIVAEVISYLSWSLPPEYIPHGRHGWPKHVLI